MWISRLFRRPSVWIVLVLVIGVAAVAIQRARGPVVRTTTAVERALEQHLVASGRVRVPTRVQIAAQTGGQVVAVGVVAGQRVTAGDLLVQLDDREQRAGVAQAEAAVKQAKARVEQLRRVGRIVATEGLRQAETNLERAEADLGRATRLVAGAAVPEVELENARRAVEIARAQKTAAEAQQMAAAPLGADSRVALGALLQAEAQLSAVQVRLAQARIVAPANGTVLSRSVEPGDVVQPARTLLVLAADADVELVFFPDERNLSTIQLGQAARASADAFPQQIFTAKVSFVAPSIDPERGSVEVRLAVTEPPSFLRPDMTVSIDLLVAAKDRALTLPSAAVHDLGTPRPWVLTVEGGRVRRRDLGVGIRGDGAIEITAGLEAGLEVIVPDGRPLAIGARVRSERE